MGRNPCRLKRVIFFTQSFASDWRRDQPGRKYPSADWGRDASPSALLSAGCSGMAGCSNGGWDPLHLSHPICQPIRLSVDTIISSPYSLLVSAADTQYNLIAVCTIWVSSSNFQTHTHTRAEWRVRCVCVGGGITAFLIILLTGSVPWITFPTKLIILDKSGDKLLIWVVFCDSVCTQLWLCSCRTAPAQM